MFSTLLIRWEWCNRLRSLLPTDMKRKPLVSVLLAPFHTDTCLPGCCCHYHVADLILVKGVRLSRCWFFFFWFVFFGLIVLHSWGFLRDIYSLLSQPCVVVYCLRWICSVYSVLWCMLSACLLLQTWRVTSSTTCDSQGQDAYSTEPTGTPPTISCITMMTSTWKSSVYDHNEGLICIL